MLFGTCICGVILVPKLPAATDATTPNSNALTQVLRNIVLFAALGAKMPNDMLKMSAWCSMANSIAELMLLVDPDP